MKVRQNLALSQNYDAARQAEIRYLVIHGAECGGAEERAAHYAEEAVGTSVHYLVDDAEIWCSVPEEGIAWHCGTRGMYFHPHCRNANSIGIALCSGQAGPDAQTVEMAEKLVRWLRGKYNIKPECILRHFDVTRKNCPEFFVRRAGAWRNFLDQALMGGAG